MAQNGIGKILAVILLWSDRGVSGLTVNALRESGLGSVIK